VTRVSHGIDRLDVIFDEPTLVANAGLLLIATLSQRLGLEAVIDSTVRLVGRVGGACPGRKVLTLVHAMIAGASHIDHADMLRAGATAGVLGHRVMAPSTLGTFLRAFTFGHVRQLEAVIGRALERAWRLGAGPGTAPLVIDVDSTICEVDGKHKQGAGYGYTHVLGYHPILATRADTGEVLHARMRKGQANTQRGARRFLDELIARVHRAGASGEITIRMDSGFWSNDTIVTLGRLNVRYTMAVRTSTNGVSAAIARIPEKAWRPIDYSADGEAQVAECPYTTTGTGRQRTTRRLIVRRTRLTDTVQQRLWPDWRHHAFLTDMDDDAVDVDRFHRHHAVIELAIRDLKDGAGLGHVPSGHFHANSAWLQCVVLAHNLIRWTATLGDVRVDDELTVARTIRTRLIGLPGRLVNRAGRPTLRLPDRWPWAATFTIALTTLRLLRPAPT
jgi:Transposase DDE domain group 1